MNARSYLAFLLWFVPVIGGIGLFGIAVVVSIITSSTGPAIVTPAFIGFAMILVGLPLIALHWFVSAFARPKALIPPPYRAQRGSVAESQERRRRRRVGMPPTDHLVEILDVRPLSAEEGFEPYMMARCSEPECDWFEFADAKLIGMPEEEQLRSKAAEHSTAIAPGLHRPLG